MSTLEENKMKNKVYSYLKGVIYIKLNPQKTGLTLGSVYALFHFLWGLLVVAGLAQVWLDFIFSLHFLNNPLTVQSFDVTKWVILLVVTFLVGYVLGYVFAWLWNRLHR